METTERVRVHGRRAILLQRRLLDWYDRSRVLWPWRQRADWYAVWVAETMLQQTRVTVVERAYRQFLSRFPNLQALASAEEEEVLAAWSGLGYYTRARNLHQAARLLVAEGRKEFPEEPSKATALPGVGTYTASAVLSISFGKPLAAVDANVRRVLSRIFALREAGTKTVHGLATSLLDRKRPGDWNQALMELGQRICTPRQPLCSSCPVKNLCISRGQLEHCAGRVKSKRPKEKVVVCLLVVTDTRGRVLLERGHFPFLRHLWLPIFVPPGESCPLPQRTAVPKGRIHHAIVNRVFDVTVLSAKTSPATLDKLRAAARAGSERRVFSRDQLSSIGRSSLLTKALASVLSEAAPQALSGTA